MGDRLASSINISLLGLESWCGNMEEGGSACMEPQIQWIAWQGIWSIGVGCCCIYASVMVMLWAWPRVALRITEERWCAGWVG